MTREEIKKWLDDGDYIKIARRCAARGRNTSRVYVCDVMNGRRKYAKGVGKMIMEEAELIAIGNKKEIEQVELHSKPI